MKKIAIVLGVLVFAAPALAEVAITATDEGSGVAKIAYASDVNVSAFALEITVTDGNISSISDYHVGDCNATEQGYGIFPANFNRYIDANNPDWDNANYTPVADACDPGAAGTGLGTVKIIVEMGALYEDGNQPPLSGTLCKVTVTEACYLSVVANALRGKVVLTDFSEVDPNVAGATSVPMVFDCFPSCRSGEYAEWVSVGKPDSWCNVRQCNGDADGIENEYGPPPPPILTRPKAWVAYEDLQFLVAGYKSPYGGDPEVDTWIAADFNRQENEYGPPPPPILTRPKARITTEDLQILVAYYKNPSVPTDCLDCP
jgi:hypothetical protein